MNDSLRKSTLIVFGWFFVIIGLVGVFLPILPTTPFLILALALFSKSSPRFHQMLLRNPWFGPALRDWEQTRCLPRKIKVRATLVIVITFSLSIMLFSARPVVQGVLAMVALAVLVFIWKIKETEQSNQ